MFVWVHSVAGRDGFTNRDVLYAAMTRFDVPMPAVPGAVAIRERGEMARWTVDRTALFRETCLPAMLRQRPRPHAWLILFNRDVAPPVAALLDDLRPHDWIVPLLLGEDWGARVADETRAALGARFGGAFPYLCCTRVDNDDALHGAFHGVVDGAIAKLRRRDAFTTPVCINLPYGAMREGGRLLVRVKERHFFALAETWDGFRGPYQRGHTKIDEVAPVVDVFTEQPMWCHLRHDHNVGAGAPPAEFEAFANPLQVLGRFGLADAAWDDREAARLEAWMEDQDGEEAWEEVDPRPLTP